MANKYCNLDGTKKISQEYTKITEGFDKVDGELSTLLTHLSRRDNPHLTTKAQVGLGNVVNVRQATEYQLAELCSRVDDIITTPMDGISTQEIIDARRGHTSLRKSIESTNVVLNVTNFGAIGDGVVDDTTSFQNAIDHATNNKTPLYIPEGNYLITGSLYIDAGIKLYGSGENSTIIIYSGVGYAIVVGRVNSVSRLQIRDLTLRGTHQGNGIQFGAGKEVVDSMVANVRIEFFAVGFHTKSAWTNTFSLVRTQGCGQCFILSTASNNLLFDNCAFVSSTKTSTFNNCEGVLFNSCEFANNPNKTVMSIHQSQVVFINPYFENITNLCNLGSWNDQVQSSLVIYGGMLCGEISVIGRFPTLIVDGAHIKNDITPFGIRNFTPDEMFSKTMKNYRMQIYENAGVIVKPKLIYSITGTKQETLSNAYGGSTLSYELLPDAIRLKHSGTGNGILIPYTFTPNTQYTLVYSIRGSAAIRITGKNTVRIPTSDLLDTHYSPFILPDGATNIRLLFDDKIDLNFLYIYEGLPNTNTIKSVDYSLRSGGNIPISGEWTSGTVIFNNKATTDKNVGWICTGGGSPGTWAPFGTIA